jgi:hypothetical protein
MNELILYTTKDGRSQIKGVALAPSLTAEESSVVDEYRGDWS